MDKSVVLVPILCVWFLIVFAKAQNEEEGSCFEFYNNSYIHFTPNNFDNNDNVHYSFKIRTTAEHGMIMYGIGHRYEDDEALFMRDGKLYYHLYNMSPTGIGGDFGGFFEGDEIVNTGEWITVHLYRIWEVLDPARRRLRRQTGFVVEMNGQIYEHLDYLDRSDIVIHPTIYFGGYKEELSDTVNYFMGEIKDIREEKNRAVFETPSFNYMSKVGLVCIDVDPV